MRSRSLRGELQQLTVRLHVAHLTNRLKTAWTHTAHPVQHGADGRAPGEEVIDVEQRVQRRMHLLHLPVEKAVLEPAAAAMDRVSQHLTREAGEYKA